MRKAEMRRQTSETNITVSTCLDGAGESKISTGIGFFDHLLASMARFAFYDILINCVGDLKVDTHHTIEDVAITLGQAIKNAAGDKAHIIRTAHAYFPMDDALVFCALDFCDRAFLRFDTFNRQIECGGITMQLCEEFFLSLCRNAGITMHISVMHGKNDHHILEALFKAAGKALGEAVRQDPRVTGVHSTKGTLDR